MIHPIRMLPLPGRLLMSSFTARVSMLLALSSAACAPMRQPGALSPVSARVTNEVVAEDGRTFEAWSRRVVLLRQGGAPASPTRDYLVARAAAWLGYARETYAHDPADRSIDAALAETRRVVLSLEQGITPEVGALPVIVDTPARPDLWQVLARARASALAAGSSAADAPAAMADAEVALVLASRLAAEPPSWRAGPQPLSAADRVCAQQFQIARAARLIAALHIADEPVQVANITPLPVATPVAFVAQPTMALPVRRGVERVVHFAVNSSDLALASRMTLGEVIAMLRSHPKVNVVIRGFTDPRGSEAHNRGLAVRRAERVQRFLEAAALELGRVTIEGVGTDAASTSHASIDAFAHDRRVTLAFTGSDGAPLTVSALQALAVNHEQDLQLERPRAMSQVGRARMTSGRTQ